MSIANEVKQMAQKAKERQKKASLLEEYKLQYNESIFKEMLKQIEIEANDGNTRITLSLDRYESEYVSIKILGNILRNNGFKYIQHGEYITVCL